MNRRSPLRPVDDLGPSEVHVGALGPQHQGLTVVVRRGRNVLTGPLIGTPSASMTKPLLVLQVGDFRVALQPTASVLVVPDGGKAVITLTPQTVPDRSESGRGPSPSSGVVGDAINGERSMKLLPGRWRNRRKCLCSCEGKRSHGGCAGGVAMTSGCDWAMRYWVNHGRLPSQNRVSLPGDGT